MAEQSPPARRCLSRAFIITTALISLFGVVISAALLARRAAITARGPPLPPPRQQLLQHSQHSQHSALPADPVFTTESPPAPVPLADASNWTDLLRGRHAGGVHYRVFFAILSSQRSVDADWRAGARRTWLRAFCERARAMTERGEPSVGYRFFVGDPERAGGSANDPPGRAAVQNEAQEYGDITVLDGVPDTYEGLTRKTAAVISWLAAADFTYDLAAKVDNDVYVIIDRLLPRLLQLAPPPGAPQPEPDRLPLYFGSFFWKHHKRTNVNHKNYERVWPLPVFPPYAAGPFYVLEAPIIRILGRSMHMLQKTYSNEDAAVGIWLSPLKVSMIDDRYVIWPKRRCFDAFLVKQVYSVDQFDKFQKKLLSKTPLCEGFE